MDIDVVYYLRPETVELNFDENNFGFDTETYYFPYHLAMIINLENMITFCIDTRCLNN